MHINVVVRIRSLYFLDECLPVVPTKLQVLFFMVTWFWGESVGLLFHEAKSEDVLQVMKGIQFTGLESLVKSETLKMRIMWILGPQLQPFHSFSGLPLHCANVDIYLHSSYFCFMSDVQY